jgi:hypothetical protein
MYFRDSVLAIIRIQSNRGIGVMRIQAGIEYLCAFVQEESAAETGFRDQGGVVEISVAADKLMLRSWAASHNCIRRVRTST